MEEMVEHIRVNLNKELWRHDSNYTNSEIGNLEGVTGYNGDITQYLQEKGYMWEQLNESSIKFQRDSESKNK